MNTDEHEWSSTTDIQTLFGEDAEVTLWGVGLCSMTMV